jgi:hypothetical protein
LQDDASTLQYDHGSLMNNSEATTTQSPTGLPDSPRMASEKEDSVAGANTVDDTVAGDAYTAATTVEHSVSTGTTFMKVVAHLGRLAVHASARTAEEFWPPPSVSEPSETHGPAQVGAMDSSLHSEGMVDEERPIISIVAEGGLLKYQQV